MYTKWLVKNGEIHEEKVKLFWTLLLLLYVCFVKGTLSDQEKQQRHPSCLVHCQTGNEPEFWCAMRSDLRFSIWQAAWEGRDPLSNPPPILNAKASLSKSALPCVFFLQHSKPQKNCCLVLKSKELNSREEEARSLLLSLLHFLLLPCHCHNTLCSSFDLLGSLFLSLPY